MHERRRPWVQGSQGSPVAVRLLQQDSGWTPGCWLEAAASNSGRLRGPGQGRSCRPAGKECGTCCHELIPSSSSIKTEAHVVQRPSLLGRARRGGWAGACAAERPVEAGGAEGFAGGSSGDAAAGAFDEGAVGQGLAHRARGCGSGWLWWRGVPRGWPSRWAAARAGGGYAWAVRRRAAMIAPTVVRTGCGSDRAAMTCCSCSRLQPRDRSADGNRPAGADTCAARQRHQDGGEQDPGADAAEKGSARNPVSHARSLQQLLARPPPRLVAPRLFGDQQPRQYVARRRQTGRAGSTASGTG